MANSTLFGTVKILVGPKFGTKSGVWEAFLGPNEVCKPTPEMHTFFGGPNRGFGRPFWALMRCAPFLVTIKTLQVAEWSVICQ